MFFLIVGGILVVVLIVAFVVDLRDRGNSGTKKVRMPGWLERRGRGQMASGPVVWDAADDYRPKSPREREENEFNQTARSDDPDDKN